MSDVPLADTCVCGVPYWHRFMGAADAPVPSSGHSSGAVGAASKFLWCKKCGAVRVIFETRWQIPLDRAGEIARSVPLDGDEERPTNPGTPKAKREGPPDPR
jgi:hypothetical protein